MSWLGIGNDFDSAVEKATSEMIPQGQEDMSLFLEICDKIRGKEVSARDAMRSLKKRLGHKNPNVQLLALKLSDVCVKNGGSLFLAEVASREYMDFILQLVKQDNVNHEVKQKSLGLLQSWAFAFKNKTQLAYAVDTYNRLKSEGFSFPPVSEKTNEIMIDSSEAPEWTDSDVCERCRSLFTLTNRKHHCRNCGKTFCNSCSSQTMPLPKFGINKDVRVCDPCYATLNGRAYEAPRTPTVETGASLSKEEEELQRAIALSLLETEKNSGSSAGYVKPAPVAQKKPEDDDPELMAAIKASLKEAELQKSKSRENVSVYPTSASPPPQQRASSPPPARHHSQGGVAAPPVVVAQNPNELSQQEQQSVALFYQLVEKIDADSTGTLAGNILNDQQLKGLHEQMTKIHPKIVKGIEECVEKHRRLMELHEKISGAVKNYDKIYAERLAAFQQAQAAAQYRPPVVSPQQQQQGGQPFYQNQGYVYGAVPPPQQQGYYAPPAHQAGYYAPPVQQPGYGQPPPQQYYAPPQNGYAPPHQSQSPSPQQQQQPQPKQAPPPSDKPLIDF